MSYRILLSGNPAKLRKPREIAAGEHAALIATVLGLPKKPEPQPEKKRA